MSQRPEKPAKSRSVPPAAYRFKPGQSGNPSGRPKGTRSLARELEAALKQTITIRVRGRAKRVTKLEATMKKLADLAASGDARMVRLLIDQLKEAEARAEPETAAGFAEADRAVIAALLKRLNGT